MRNIIITLPHELWRKILSGDKTFELRTKCPLNFTLNKSKCYVVIKGSHLIVGWFSISTFIQDRTEHLNLSYLSCILCVPPQWIFDYVKKHEIVWFWHIGKVFRLEKPANATDIFHLKANPQSFIYTDIDISE